MPTFSPNLEHTLHRAVGEANLRKHEFATLEHLLFGLLDDKDAVAVLRACDVNVRQLRAEIKSYLDLELENIKTEQGGEATPTSGFQRVIQRAILHVQSSGREEVTGANVLIALFSERESHATYFLQLAELIGKVVQIKRALLHLARHAIGLFSINRCRRLFDQRHDITHA